MGYEIALVNITDGTVQGHKAGCADLKRGNLRKHAADVWEFPVDDKAEAWLNYNSDFLAEGGEDNAYEIQWSPCAKHVPEGDTHARYVEAFESDETEQAESVTTYADPEHARRNFLHLAEQTGTEAGRAFWQAKADAI